MPFLCMDRNQSLIYAFLVSAQTFAKLTLVLKLRQPDYIVSGFVTKKLLGQPHSQ